MLFNDTVINAKLMGFSAFIFKEGFYALHSRIRGGRVRQTVGRVKAGTRNSRSRQGKQTDDVTGFL